MSSAADSCGAIFFVILTIVGFVGNLMTAIVLFRDRKIRQHSTTAFILSLCISDFMCSSFTMPMLAASFLNEDLMNDNVLCKIFGSTFYINFGITTFSIAAIAINRYILVVHHHLYKRFYRMSTVLCQLAFIWLVPVGLLITPMMDKWGTIAKYRTLCRLIEKDGQTIKGLLHVVGIFTPCLIISVLYACIYYKVRQQSKNVSKHNSCGSTIQAKERERHLTIMTFLIFISFMVCCVPAIIEHFFFVGCESPWPNVLTMTFCCLLCIVNPFIYAATNRKYRAAYLKLFADLKFWNSTDQDQITIQQMNNTNSTDE